MPNPPRLNLKLSELCRLPMVQQALYWWCVHTRDEDNCVTFSTLDMAKRMDRSETGVIKAIRGLVEKGKLKRVVGGGGRGLTNVYEVC